MIDDDYDRANDDDFTRSEVFGGKTEDLNFPGEGKNATTNLKPRPDLMVVAVNHGVVGA